MKNFLLLAGLFVLTYTAHAQTSEQNIRVHILMKTGLFNGTTIWTTANPTKAIKLKSESYTLLNVNADSLGIILHRRPDKSEYSDDYVKYDDTVKKVMMEMNRSHDYYFIISQNYHSPSIINEVNKNAFLLNLAYSSNSSKPSKVYDLP